MKNICLSIFALALMGASISGCKSDPANQGDADLSTGGDTTLVAYWRMSGNIGERDIVMHLVRYLPASGSGAATFQGYFYDDISEQPMAFYGSIDSLGRLVLQSSSPVDENDLNGTFIAAFNDNGSLEGTWMSQGDSKIRPFRLVETYPEGSVPLTAYYLVDSSVLNAGRPNSPRAFTSLSWLQPSPNAPGAIKSFLAGEIRKGVLGDSLAGMYSSLENAFQVSRDSFFAQYKAEAREFAAEDTSLMETFNYDQSKSVVVYYNEKNILTLGFMEYVYTGGVHGMYATNVRSFDLKSRRQITLADVFKEGYEKGLKKPLEDAVRRLYNLAPDAPLNTILFENEIAPTENFGLTGQGIFFTYAPYEVAAYALGEIEVYVPFREIKDILKPGIAK